MDSKKIINRFVLDQIEDLSISVSYANIVFQETSDSEIRVEAEGLELGKYSCERKGNQLKIFYDCRRMIFINVHGKTAKITVYLPTEQILKHKFGNVQFELGAGDMKIKDVPFSCRNLNAEIGAGKWEANQLAVSQRLHVEIGAGSVKMKKTTAGSLEINCGAGNCIYKGLVNGDIKLDCGVGNCKLYLENKENDFQYTISSALGKVSVNGNNMRTFGTGKMYTGKGRLGTAILQCGMGNIEVETQ